MYWKVLALCDVRVRPWRKAAMDTWLYPCDACAKGELVHAEATSTSDLVFGISNFAAIELYQSYGCASHIGIVPRQNGHGEPRHLDTSTASTASTQTSTPRHRSHMESALTDLDRPRHKPRHRLDRGSTASTPRQPGLCFLGLFRHYAH
jgi:hypothetical protein